MSARAKHVGKGKLWGVALFVTCFFGGGSLIAQLTDEDIARLRERGKQEGWTFRIGHNYATRHSPAELCGSTLVDESDVSAPPKHWMESRDLPDAFCWCDYGVCGPVVLQWGPHCKFFSITGAAEITISIVENQPIDLSERWLIECSNREHWNGDLANYLLAEPVEGYVDPCGGYGPVLEADMPYLPPQGCNCPYDHYYHLNDWNRYSGLTVAQIKQLILDYGPCQTTVLDTTAFNAYNGGVLNDCEEDGNVYHGVVIVGWDDYPEGSEVGVWIIRNSWGTNWGEDLDGNSWDSDNDGIQDHDGGYARITYGCIHVANTIESYIYDPDPVLWIVLPEGQPSFLGPDDNTMLDVQIQAKYGAVLDPNNAVLNYSWDGENWLETPLTHVSGDDYQATLPSGICLTTLQWYISALDQTTDQLFYSPANAPTETYSTVVATGIAQYFVDRFETDRGWGVQANAQTGNWERADPKQVEDGRPPEITQPEDDHSDPGTLCYVTGWAPGVEPDDNDVNGGITILTSPLLDLSGLDPVVSYWRWFHISGVEDDMLSVLISNNNGVSWKTVESVDSRQPWTYVEWKVSDYYTPNNQMRVRFTVSDLGSPSLVEALVDDFVITELLCIECYGDLDHNGAVALADQAILLAHYGQTGGARYEDGDMDHDGDVDIADLGALLAEYGTTCE